MQMLTTFIISFRETLEMFIMILPLLAYIKKTNKDNLSKFIYIGGILGALCSIGSGVFIFVQAKSIEGHAQQIFVSSMMIFLSALILYNVFMLGKNTKTMTFDDDKKFAALSPFSLFMITFITIFRESLEIIIFTLPLINSAPIDIISSLIVGTVCSFVLMLVVYKFALKLNMVILFDILTIMLIIIGAIMFGEALVILIPSGGSSLEIAAKMIYGIPLLFLFLKREFKKLINKKIK